MLIFDFVLVVFLVTSITGGVLLKLGGMIMFRTIVLAGMAALALALPAHAQQTTTEFQQGLADRDAWESWFASLTGEYRSGAYLWTGQRSLPNPTPCDSLGGEATMGCYAAKARLDVSDYRRHIAPAYRQGWNSWIAPAPAAPPPPPAPAPAPQPTTIIVQQTQQPVIAAPAPAPQPAPSAFPNYDVVNACRGDQDCTAGAYAARGLSVRIWQRAGGSVQSECRQAADQFADYGTLYMCLQGHGVSMF
jgi:hypothetical protein